MTGRLESLPPRWQFWIDVGGTFTDCVARSPTGELRRHKRLSSGVTKGRLQVAAGDVRVMDDARATDPDGFWRGATLRLLDDSGRIALECRVENSQGNLLSLAAPLPMDTPETVPYELISADQAPLQSIRHLLGLAADDPLPPVEVRLGTTRGTNALLTRSGARTALVTTRGFRDILRIGYQNRPHLFALQIQQRQALFETVAEITERHTASGEVLVTPDPHEVKTTLLQLQQQGIDSLAICFLHADRYPAHEELVEKLAKEIGFQEISRSSRVAPLIKIVSRGDTTVVDAYLNPVLGEYIQHLQSRLPPSSRLRLLTSAGGLVDAEHFSGKDSLLSGPAGGVVGYSRVAAAAGFTRAIGFDMGGTSTDVSRFDGRIELEYETEKAGVRLVTPMTAIETVAAGGGSICWFDGVKLAVGPDSAGADPGPACYGRGGPLTVTDLNYFLGRIAADSFPFPLDGNAVEERLSRLGNEIAAATGRKMSLLDLADGFLSVANNNMTQAIRSISVAKGYDPADYVLVVFGGAAAQHACAIARELGIDRILNHPDAGILSAYGVGMADITRHRVRGIYRPAEQVLPAEFAAIFQDLADEATQEVLQQGVARAAIEVEAEVELRYLGTDSALTVPYVEGEDYVEAFTKAHQRLYGYAQPERELEVVAARLLAVGRSDVTPPTSQRPRTTRELSSRQSKSSESVEIAFGGVFQTAVRYRRAEVQAGDVIAGPALILEAHATTVIDPDWRATCLTGGELLLEKTGESLRSSRRRADVDTEPDPVLLEIFNHHFAAIAEQMGITLRNTASSVNVKERLDFSCALFTASGELVVNAPHIPVHLGAMSETVQHVIRDLSPFAAGDVIVTNDPYRGGSHLPDITVITPVHDEQTGELRFFTASRAHHAEIGGIAPGSMSPFTRHLGEEGVLIRNFYAVRAGVSRMTELQKHLQSGPYPSRSVGDNLADISAQIAANRQGADALARLIATYQWPTVSAYMLHIQRAAEQQVRLALHNLEDGSYSFEDHLDDGSPIRLSVKIEGDQATFDFRDTGAVVLNNLNANRAIVTAAVMYCLRCMIEKEIPLNHGVLSPVRIDVPVGLLNPPAGDSPESCPAVAGGNVETSQRVVDVILGALRLAAASQGTMNNVLFGDASFGYYETVCGGSGATPAGPGASAVHTHMTNTRLTDPEILEQRYPIRIPEFSIRAGSGGAGRHRGGDGVVRKLEFLRPLQLSLLTQRRGPFAPYGLDGGRPGALGVNRLVRADGRTEELGATAQVDVATGDTLILETPGGGGWGSPD